MNQEDGKQIKVEIGAASETIEGYLTLLDVRLNDQRPDDLAQYLRLRRGSSSCRW